MMTDNIDDARAAAGIRPALRTTAQQALVNRNTGDQQVRNNDHDAAKAQRINGTR